MQSDIRSESKLNSILYGISFAHKQSGFKDPCSSKLVSYVKEGMLRSIGKTHQSKKPLNKTDIEKIITTFGNDNCLINKRFVAMSVLSFYGFLRFSEVVSLRRSDIVFEDDCIKLKLRSSKTDQFGTGASVCIAKTGTDFCPVRCLDYYLTAAKIHDNSDDFLFRNVYFSKKTGMHMLRKGKSISYSRAREIFVNKLSSLGYDSSKYGLHSYRSGGATTAAINGVSDRLLKKHGRWKTEVSKDKYIHESESSKKSVSLKMSY
jgi:integrase